MDHRLPGLGFLSPWNSNGTWDSYFIGWRLGSWQWVTFPWFETAPVDARKVTSWRGAVAPSTSCHAAPYATKTLIYEKFSVLLAMVNLMWWIVHSRSLSLYFVACNFAINSQITPDALAGAYNCDKMWQGNRNKSQVVYKEAPKCGHLVDGLPLTFGSFGCADVCLPWSSVRQCHSSFPHLHGENKLRRMWPWASWCAADFSRDGAVVISGVSWHVIIWRNNTRVLL